MAESPSHRFGQIIGEVLEAAVEPLLATFAEKHGLYLDKKGDRPCRPGKRCTWLDLNNNKHDLDFVLERGGTPEKLGVPAAFIETAWRRYTKHSRNKAQEIQGAIGPLAETYKNARPFVGVVLAGVFTKGALDQLRSLRFSVLYFSYESVVAAFEEFGIDASSEEDTPDSKFAKKVAAYEGLSNARRTELPKVLLATQKRDVAQFMASLEKVVSRQIERVIVLPLHGKFAELATIDEAIKFIESYEEFGNAQPIERYEIQVRYNNDDSIQASFRDKSDAVAFLRTYLPIPIAAIPKKQ